MKVRRPTRAWLPLLIALASFAAPCAAATASVQEALYRARPAVVLVTAEVKAEAIVDCGRGPVRFDPTPFVQTGTAWFVDGRGFLITNAHVVDPAHRRPAWVLNELKKTTVDEACVLPALQARRLEFGARPDIEEEIRRAVPLGSITLKTTTGLSVRLSNGQNFTPEVVKFDPPPVQDRSGRLSPSSGRDLALLRVPNGTYPALALAPGNPNLGDPVHVLGFPSVVIDHELLSRTTPLDPSATNGRVSGFKKNAIGQTLIQTDAAVAHGSSGGPAVNDNAAVLGIVVAISLTRGGRDQYQGFNFLIPATDVSVFLRDTGVRPGESVFSPIWAQGIAAHFQGRHEAALEKFREADRLLPKLPDVERLIEDAEQRIRTAPSQPLWMWLLAGGVGALGTAIGVSVAARWWWRNRFRVTARQVVAYLERGLAPVLLDVRTAEDHDRSPLRLPGAVRLDPEQVAHGRGLDLVVEPAQPIVTYCASRDEQTSARVCRQLRRRGFSDVRILKGGLGAWANAGLPVEGKTHLPAIGVELYRNLALGDIERRCVAAGEVIFREGEDADGNAYVIHAGSVEIRKRIDGVDRHLNVMSEGQLLGAMALFRKTPRSASAVALTATELLVLPRDRLEWLIRHRPHLTLEVLKELSDQVVAGDRSRVEDAV
ncbi:MAG: trypsin-like peptidase domain-containing protein [Candidatus Rokuibacteriota bacterium]